MNGSPEGCGGNGPIANHSKTQHNENRAPYYWAVQYVPGWSDAATSLAWKYDIYCHGLFSPFSLHIYIYICPAHTRRNANWLVGQNQITKSVRFTTCQLLQFYSINIIIAERKVWLLCSIGCGKLPYHSLCCLWSFPGLSCWRRDNVKSRVALGGRGHEKLITGLCIQGDRSISMWRNE